MQNIIKHNDVFNKRTNTLLYKDIISHALFSKGDVFCVWEMSWRRGQTAILTPSSSSTIAALLSHLGWVAQPWATEGPKPSVCHWLSLQHLVSKWLKPSVPWLYYCLTLTCFRCSSAYLHGCISWLTARLRVNV